MIAHKCCHKCGLDTLIYNQIKNIKSNKEYFLYIYDYCRTQKDLPNNYYNENNNENNTWNYNLKYHSTKKDIILNDNIKFGFPDYRYCKDDEFILVKGIGHIQTLEKYGQSHIVSRNIFEEKYDKNKYIGQKILKTSENLNEELNVFIVRNLDTRELQFFCVLCINDTTVNINRKKSKVEFKLVDISILGDKRDKFIEYMNYINMDYGRIELLKDKNLGWCVIDINNSPGDGPITKMVFNDIIKMFKNVINK